MRRGALRRRLCSTYTARGRTGLAGRPWPDALAAIGTTAPTYQGATGRIAFDANGDPVNKVLLGLHLDANGRTHVDGFLGTFR
jgi:hypothetical protein